jgi:uncharacterized membrane protein
MNDAPAPTQQPHTPVERATALVLRTGVFASVAVVLLGMVVSVVRHPGALSDKDFLVRLTSGGSAYPTTLPALARELAEVRGRAVVTLGLLLLIATPLLRVAVSMVAFALERDWIYTALTLLVLTVLAVSFLVGRVS